LKQSQVGRQDVVEVNLRVLPGEVHFRRLVEAFDSVGDDGGVDDDSVDVDTRTKPAAEQVDSHDTED